MTLDECIDYAEKQSEWMSKYAMIDIYKDKSEYYRQLAEWLKKLKAYKIKFEFIISQLEERARQLEDILEKNSWCDGDEEYRLDEINSVVEFIKKTYESKSVLDKEVNADDT